MGILLPQLAPASEDRVSGAQVITSSLKFNGHQSGGVHGYGHLRRTSSGASGGGTFTISWWAKRSSMRGDWQYMIAGDNGSLWGVGFAGSSGQLDSLTLFNGSHQYSAARFRDNSGWYHIVLNVNGGSGAQLWVNGELQSNTNTNASWNLNNTMYIGKWNDSGTPHNYDGYLAQYTCIDGLELGPAYFAETDPLTGAWRPKRFYAEGTTVNDGTNWSSSVSNAANSATNLFDGGTSNYTEGNTNGTPVTWSGNVTGITKLEFYAVQAGSSRTFTVNGVDRLDLVPTSAGWFTVPDVTTLTAFSFSRGGSGNYVDLFAVRVDGVIMTNNTTQNLAFGNAGFYLPLDGNTPVGQDLSGNGNDWKPQGFGGSVELDSTLVTGARPILNTTQGGAIAAPGVFGSKENKFYTVTTANGGVYQFDITSGDNPSLSFIRGATYKFDYSSHTGHPLLFSSSNPDSSVTAYTTGTNIASNVISFTVPHDAPDTLYYYCSAHPTNMNGAISVTTDETKADKYAANCVLAMPLVGSNTDVCDQINCTTTAKVLAPQGNASESSGQSNWYGGSYYFDGSGDYLGATSHADFAMGTGDFTLECWVYRSSVGGFMNFLATRGGPGTTAGYTWGAQSSGNGYDVEFYTNNMTGINGGNQWVTGGQWHHVAITRTGTTLSSYVNGILNTTTTNSQNFTNTSLAVGMTNDGSQGPFHGYIQDVRIYKGVAKYTGGTVDNQVFIIPATEPNFIPDCPAGVATKSKLKKITDGAVSFDGNGDSLVCADSADWDFGTGDFTIECFAYFNDTTSANSTMINRWTDIWTFQIVSSTQNLRFYAGASDNLATASNTIGPNKWYHFAASRSSGTLKLFIDGVESASSSFTKSLSGSVPLNIGAENSTQSLPTKGHISNVRIVNGTALYTSNFTPPTRELTNVTNTKLLCCQSNTEPGGAVVAPTISGPNDGTQWSSKVTSGSEFRSGYGPGNAFDGNSVSSISGTTACEINKVSFVEFDFGNGIPFTTLQMQCDDNNEGTVKVNGVDITSQLPTGSLTNTTITGVTSPLKTVRLDAVNANASSVYLGSITIDGTMLVDPVAPGGDEAPVATKFNPLNTDITTVRKASGSQVTLNAKDYRSFANGPTYNLQNGNLTAYMVGGNANASKDRGLVASTIDIPNGGKWYCEIHTEYMQNDDIALGIASQLVKGYYELGGNSKPGAYLLRQNGIFHYPTGQLSSSSSRQYNSGDMVGLAVDFASDTKTITFYKNGFELYSYTVDILQGPFKVVAGTDAGSSVGTYRLNFNFGQKPFKFPPPVGFKALTTVRPDTVITHPDQYIKATTYRGNGASRSIDVGFRPDMIWLKDRTQATHNNNVIDSLNGAPNIIVPDNAGTTLITNTTDGLTAITDTGFNLGANTGGTQSYELNKNGNNYVAWTWRAGGAPTATNTNTSGAMAANSVSIDGVLQSAYTPSGSPNKYPSKMSIGTKQGFSVVQFELGGSDNKDIPHGLSEIPTFYIIKNVDGSDNWVTYTTNKDGSLDYVFNYGTDGFSDSSRTFPTTSTVNFLSNTGGTHIMYCWHDVPGLHKSGTYRGFNSSNGPVVDLGFRPAIILLKKLTNTDSNSGWHWYDNKRNTSNPANNFLLAGHAYYENRAANNTADVSSYTVDFTSNGFRMSHGSNNLNYTNETYFYAAWAEAPAFNLYGGQANAR